MAGPHVPVEEPKGLPANATNEQLRNAVLERFVNEGLAERSARHAVDGGYARDLRRARIDAIRSESDRLEQLNRTNLRKMLNLPVRDCEQLAKEQEAGNPFHYH